MPELPCRKFPLTESVPGVVLGSTDADRQPGQNPAQIIEVSGDHAGAGERSARLHGGIGNEIAPEVDEAGKDVRTAGKARRASQRPEATSDLVQDIEIGNGIEIQIAGIGAGQAQDNPLRARRRWRFELLRFQG
ncbi:MAG: hypothetical protein WDN28_00860 [Chthoniobacter sp.]